MKIERDKLYRTRSGKILKVVCVDRPTDYSIIAMCPRKGDVYNFLSNGKSWENIESPYDLIAEAREPREWTLIFRPSGVLATSLGPEIKRDEIIRVREILDEK